MEAAPTVLDSALVGALYVARSRDSGLQPSQSGARRFDAEVAAVQPNAERDGANSPAVLYGGPRAINLSALRLGPRSAQLIAHGIAKPSAVHLHGNPSLGDGGAASVLPLLEHGTRSCAVSLPRAWSANAMPSGQRRYEQSAAVQPSKHSHERVGEAHTPWPEHWLGQDSASAGTARSRTRGTAMIAFLLPFIQEPSS